MDLHAGARVTSLGLQTGALPPEHPVRTFEDLCLFLGGDVTSYTGLLLTLIGKADQGNLAKLRAVYPREVAARSLWMRSDASLPASELAMRTDDLVERNAALAEAIAEDMERDMAYDDEPPGPPISAWSPEPHELR